MLDDKVIKRTAFLISCLGHALFLSIPKINLNFCNIIRQKDTVLQIELEKPSPPPQINTINNEKKIEKNKVSKHLNKTPQIQEYKTAKLPEYKHTKLIELEKPSLPQTNTEEQNTDEDKVSEYTSSDSQTQESQTTSLPEYQQQDISAVRQNAMLCYLEQIKQRIEAVKIYPLLARILGIEGRVHVGFTILSEGLVQDIKVISSCGSKILDKEAIATIKRANPFAPIPKEINTSPIKITLSIVFRLQDLKEE